MLFIQIRLLILKNPKYMVMVLLYLFNILIYFNKSGVFAKKIIKKGNFVCNVPGFYFEKPTPLDNHRAYVWERVKGKLSFDSTCFEKLLLRLLDSAIS